LWQALQPAGLLKEINVSFCGIYHSSPAALFQLPQRRPRFLTCTFCLRQVLQPAGLPKDINVSFHGSTPSQVPRRYPRFLTCTFLFAAGAGAGGPAQGHQRPVLQAERVFDC